MYPPTHEGDLLKSRIEIIEREFPMFKDGNRLLDIGCNRGEFLKLWNYKETVGIDVTKYDVDMIHTSFREYHSDKQFDRILLLNGPHHMYREIKGNEWIYKLAALTEENGYVLFEGVSKRGEAQDVDKVTDEGYSLDLMTTYFDLIKTVPTINYTPGRSFMLWKRKPHSKEAGFKKIWKKDKYVNSNPVSVLIASMSPISNGLLRLEEDGWIEKQNKEPQTYCYFENEKELYIKHLQHQLFLSRVGYFDMDSATINFFKNTNELFDKCTVMPFKIINRDVMGGYIKLLNQSYNSIPVEVQQEILAALEKGDIKELESTWKKLYQTYGN